MSASNPANLDAEIDESAPEYRPISTLAVIGLLLALASVLAFVHPLLWLLPLAGAAASGWALVRLSAPDATQIGRKAALVALTLSLMLGAAAPVRWGLFRWQMQAEAQHLAWQWFEALREGNAYRAHQFTIYEAQRAAPDDDLATRYSEPEQRRQIEDYVQDPAVQTLLSLGKYATVRYFENKALQATQEESNVVDIYAVSVREKGQTTSFFVQLVWSRNFDYGVNRWSWRLTSAEFQRAPPAGWNPPAQS